MLPPDIPISSSGFCLLGVPLGSDTFRKQIVLGRVEKIHRSLECLKVLGDSQLQTTLLRSCLSLLKFNHSLQTCRPSLILNTTTLFDNFIREAVEDIIGGPLSDWSWSKANLPCSMSGLNLRSAVLHAPAAYITTIVESFGLVSQILHHTPDPPRSLPSAISSLASSTKMTSWQCLMSLFVRNLFPAPLTRLAFPLWWRQPQIDPRFLPFPPLYLMQGTGLMLFLPQLWVCVC